jgi:hypothetical protein
MIRELERGEIIYTLFHRDKEGLDIFLDLNIEEQNEILKGKWLLKTTEPKYEIIKDDKIDNTGFLNNEFFVELNKRNIKNFLNNYKNFINSQISKYYNKWNTYITQEDILEIIYELLTKCVNKNIPLSTSYILSSLPNQVQYLVRKQSQKTKNGDFYETPLDFSDLINNNNENGENLNPEEWLEDSTIESDFEIILKIDEQNYKLKQIQSLISANTYKILIRHINNKMLSSMDNNIISKIKEALNYENY